LVFVWIPGQVGIVENEWADEMVDKGRWRVDEEDEE